MEADETMRLLMITVVIGGMSVGCSGDQPAGEQAISDSSAPGRAAPAIDWTRVDSALGRTGSLQPGDVYRFGMPRGDLKVAAGGVTLRPAFALGSWIAFKAHERGAVAMGDLVLTDSELNPVIARLQAGGVEQTAIHHHIIRESPRLLYVHIHAHGDPVAIAATVRAALALTGTPAPSAPATASSTEPFALDTAAIATALGHSGRVNGGVLQISVPRRESVRSGGLEIPPSMGLATAINFQPTGGRNAAITGDFVLLGTEVNQVIRTLGEHGIEVSSLHSHLLDEEPRLFFMHFWANAEAVTLAGGLRAALDRTNSRPASP
jgi:hypothetical protein